MFNNSNVLISFNHPHPILSIGLDRHEEYPALRCLVVVLERPQGSHIDDYRNVCNWLGRALLDMNVKLVCEESNPYTETLVVYAELNNLLEIFDKWVGRGLLVEAASQASVLAMYSTLAEHNLPDFSRVSIDRNWKVRSLRSSWLIAACP